MVEVKTAFGGSGREVRTLREALADIGAARGWIVDQGSGIERLDTAIARAGFGSRERDARLGLAVAAERLRSHRSFARNGVDW